MFEGTVSSNLDPFNENDNQTMQNALNLVGANGIDLDTPVQEGGNNFSVGQRQLLCLARAMLKENSQFILMDEATANIDPALDKQVQSVVRSNFS